MKYEEVSLFLYADGDTYEYSIGVAPAGNCGSPRRTHSLGPVPKEHVNKSQYLQDCNPLAFEQLVSETKSGNPARFANFAQAVNLSAHIREQKDDWKQREKAAMQERDAIKKKVEILLDEKEDLEKERSKLLLERAERCPFLDCAGHQQNIVFSSGREDGRFKGSVRCEYCGMVGPTSTDEETSVRLWNRIGRMGVGQ